jgi:hypothetical protein
MVSKSDRAGEQGTSLSKLEKWEIESAEYSKAQQFRTS